MRLPRLKKRYLALALASGVILGTGGIAAAYFSGGGTGTGSVHVTSPFGFKVAVHTRSGVTGPGDPTVITFAISNEGSSTPTVSFPEVATNPHATIITKGGYVTSTGSKVTGCKSSWFHASASLYFKSTTGTVTLGTHPLVKVHHNVRDAVTVTMTTTGTQDACAGKTPAIRLTIGP
jgi:hypothetical protein